MGVCCCKPVKVEVDPTLAHKHELRQQRLGQRAAVDRRLKKWRVSNKQAGIIDLCDAARNGDVQTMEVLVEDQKVSVNCRDTTRAWNRYTPLMNSASFGQRATAEYLLFQGAEPNLTNKAGETALMIAAAHDDLLMVKLLVETGEANINQTTPAGASALSLAANNGNQKLVKYLIGAGAKVQGDASALVEAAAAGNDGVAKVLAEHSTKDDDGYAKDWAKKRGNKHVLSLLKDAREKQHAKAGHDAVEAGRVGKSKKGDRIIHTMSGKEWQSHRYMQALKQSVAANNNSNSSVAARSASSRTILPPTRRSATLRAIAAGAGAPGSVKSVVPLAERRKLMTSDRPVLTEKELVAGTGEDQFVQRKDPVAPQPKDSHGGRSWPWGGHPGSRRM